MIRIDEVLYMLNSEDFETQEKGIELGKQVHSFDCFIMPYYENKSERLWLNCAKIITSRILNDNKENIYEILEWIKDMNVSGAKEIYNYLLSASPYFYKNILKKCIEQKLNEASLLEDKIFSKNLSNLMNDIELRINLEYKVDIDLVFDKIYDMYYPNTQICVNTKETIVMGIEEGKKIKCLDAFILPRYEGNCKGLWDGCAEILSSKTDEELKPYIRKILKIISDLNWPGSITIFERLVNFKAKWFEEELNYMLKYSKQVDDMAFYDFLVDLKKERNNKIIKY